MLLRKTSMSSNSLVNWNGYVVDEVDLQGWNVSSLPVHHLLRPLAHGLLEVALGEELRVDQLLGRKKEGERKVQVKTLKQFQKRVS